MTYREKAMQTRQLESNKQTIGYMHNQYPTYYPTWEEIKEARSMFRQLDNTSD